MTVHVMKSDEARNDDPMPDHAELLSEDPRFYRLVVGERLVEYEVVEEHQTIKVLSVA
ncbi:MAG: hypothetical protein HC802_05875 [Caldilineaceae bacterium]|nr:hypothetical protein [Caldilineaceae bacterium]